MPKEIALEFLRRVLPSGEGYYSYSQSGQYWQDRPVSTFEELINLSFQNNHGGFNTYFGLSQYREASYIDAKGKSKFRGQVNAIRQKALWLDIDAKGREGEYADVPSALKGLKSFLQASSLPLPMIINSGQGLHVYWAFTRPVETARWRMLAEELKNATKRFGLLCDHHRTCDPASVLRIPGTANYGSDGIVRTVTLLHRGDLLDSDGVYQTLLGLQSNGAPAPRADSQKSPVLVGSDEAGGFGDIGFTPAPAYMDGAQKLLEGPPRDPRPIVRNCEQIRRMGEAQYPAWYRAITNLKYCVKGREVAHLLSKQSTSYSESGVNKFFDYAIGESSAGPTRCEDFDMVRSGICDRCPHFGKVTVPLQVHDIVTVESQTEAAPPPAPVPLVSFTSKDFTVVPGKGIIWHKSSKEGEGFNTVDHLICESELYLKRVNVSWDEGQPNRAYVFEKRSPGRAPVEITYDIELHSGAQQESKWLKNNTLAPANPKYMKAMCDFMSIYTAAMQNTITEQHTYENFGWHELRDGVTGEEYPGFLVGDDMYSKYGVKKVLTGTRCDRGIDQWYKQSGTVDKWKEIANLYHELDQKEAQLFICAGFAAPFMRMGTGPATNIMFGLFDPWGGKGKSALLYVINAIWGHYKDSGVGATDTASARYQILATRQHLPVCMDEVTTVNEAAMSTMLYEIAQGYEKHKSKASGHGLQDTGKWATATFFAANRSLHEMMEQFSDHATAQAMRVIEFQCRFKDYTRTPMGDHIEQLFVDLKTNYGKVGREFIQRVLTTPGFEKYLQERIDYWTKKIRRYNEERFWAYGCAISLAIGERLVDWGYVKYDIPKLADFIVANIDNLRVTVQHKKESAMAILRDFLNDNLDNTLTVASANRPSESKDPGTAGGMNNFDDYVKGLPPRKVFIRRVVDSGEMSISSAEFRSWLKPKHLSYNVILQELDEFAVLIKAADQVALGRGVDIIGPGRTRVFIIDGRKLDASTEKISQ